jgi:putative ubiquitin-RnfH superfamily antitoxin RatB of RatAB toxin-antitoxin module
MTEAERTELFRKDPAEFRRQKAAYEAEQKKQR